MKEKEAMKLLRDMADIGDDLIEEAGAVRKRQKTASWRWGAIAACLCLALVGTAFAAVEIFNMRVMRERPDICDDGYSVEYTVYFYPVDRFTREVSAMADPSLPHNHKYFDTWDELEEFIGLDLVDNPVLEAAVPGPQGTQSWNQDHTEQETTHIMLLPDFTDDGDLKVIQADGSYLVDNVWVSVFESIYTERAEGELFYSDFQGGTVGDGYHAYLSLAYGAGYEVSEEVYTTPNGLTATVVETFRPDPKESIMCSAYFLIDGVAFQVVAGSNGPNGELPMPDPVRTMGVLKAVLDGFQI